VESTRIEADETELTLPQFMNANEEMMTHALTTPMNELSLPEDVPNITSIRDVDREKYTQICSSYGVELESYRGAVDLIRQKYGSYISAINAHAHCMVVVDYMLNCYLRTRSDMLLEDGAD
jgi:hypothetical protein